MSSLVKLLDSQYLGLKVEISMEGFYNFIGPTVKESSILVIDENGHVYCFCNDVAICTTPERCTFCNKLESEFRNKKRVEKQRKYFYLGHGNVNYCKTLTLDNWGEKNRIVIATH